MSIFSQRTGVSPFFTCVLEEGSDVHWSITKAKALITYSKLTPVTLPEEQVWDVLGEHDIAVSHIEHIPQQALREPGILTTTGNPTLPYLLIDGNHRAARALLEQRPFAVYVLDLPHSDKALLSEKEFRDTQAMIAQFLHS